MTAVANSNWHVAMHECGGYHDRRMACPNRTEESPDLPDRFVVEVTADDVVNGERGSCTNCPVALAIRCWLQEHGISVVGIRVGVTSVGIDLGPGRALRYWHDASNLIVLFDRRCPVEPRTVCLARLP
jgi:hypothetical protein